MLEMRKRKFREVAASTGPRSPSGRWQSWERISGVLPHSLYASARLAGAGRKGNLSLCLILPRGARRPHGLRLPNARCEELREGEPCVLGTQKGGPEDSIEPCPLLAVGPLSSGYNSLSLGFPTCKMEVVLPLGVERMCEKVLDRVSDIHWVLT